MTVFSKLTSDGGAAAVTALTTGLAAVALVMKRRRLRVLQRQEINMELGRRLRRQGPRRRPEPRYSDEPGMSAWRRKPERTQWYLDYIEKSHLLDDPIAGAQLRNEFRHKFRVTYKQFTEFVHETRESNLFSDDQNRAYRGPAPHPLEMKVTIPFFCHVIFILLFSFTHAVCICFI